MIVRGSVVPPYECRERVAGGPELQPYLELQATALTDYLSSGSPPSHLGVGQMLIRVKTVCSHTEGKLGLKIRRCGLMRRKGKNVKKSSGHCQDRNAVGNEMAVMK